MSKLYFRYGTVSSGKTLHLLTVAHNYERLGKGRVLIAKPELDTRFGYGIVKTRVGLERKADILLQEHVHYIDANRLTCSCLLVDEAQFISTEWVDQLRSIATWDHVPVMCYGLKTDFKSELFPSSKRLIEVADSIEEVRTICARCGKKATMNLKHVNGEPVFDGPSVELGSEEKYLPYCWGCYDTEKQPHGDGDGGPPYDHATATGMYDHY